MADGSMSSVGAEAKAWAAIERVMRAEARARAPEREVDDVVSRALLVAFEWSGLNGRAPSDTEARSILGGTLSSDRRTEKRRAEAEVVERPAPRRRRKQPARGLKSAEKSQLAALAEAAASEILMARMRKQLRSLEPVERVSAKRTAAIDETVARAFKAFVKQARGRSAPAGDGDRRDALSRLLILPEYAGGGGGLTLTEQAALAILIGAAGKSDRNEGTGRDVVRDVMQKIRQWRKRRPRLPFGSRVHS